MNEPRNKQINRLSFFHLSIRMFGYGNAIELQELTDENIADIENKVKQRMLSVLEAEHNEVSKELRINWFGRFYWNTPEDFEFLSGEKKLIKRMINHIKENMSSGGKRSKIYTKKKAEPICMPATNTKKTEPCVDSETEKKILFNKVNVMIQKMKIIDDDSSELYQFDISMVSVDVSSNAIIGKIVCIFCKNVNKVYHDSKYWVLSNFKKHLEKCRKNMCHHSDQLQYIFVENVPNQISNNDITITSRKSFSNGIDVLCDLDNKQNEIYFQICKQNTLALASVLRNEDLQTNVSLMFEETEHNINVGEMNPNGDCLFAALSHQLWLEKIGDSKHKEMTLALRKELVEHIQNDFNYYKQSLKGHIILGDNEHDDDDTINIKAKSFLFDKLPSPGVWGGPEILLAVQRVYNVNVVVIDQDSNCNVTGGFDMSRERSLIIYYKSISGVKLDHYDSITKIDPATIYQCMQILNKAITQSNKVDLTK